MKKPKLGELIGTNKTRKILFYFGIFLLFLFRFSKVPIDTGDDTVNLGLVNSAGFTYFGYVKQRFFGWSSRLVIDFFMMFCTRHNFFWAISTSALIVVAWLFLQILIIKNKNHFIEGFSAVLLFVALGHFCVAGGTGWVATTVNYLWPLCAAIMAVYPTAAILKGQKVKWASLLLSFLPLLLAASHEQMCLALCISFGMSLVYFFKEHKKVNLFMFAQFLFSAIFLLVAFFCPGNKQRILGEFSHFPEFEGMNIFRKLELGFSSTFLDYMMTPNFLFVIFCVLVFLCAAFTKKKVRDIVAAAVPLAFVCTHNIFSFDLSKSIILEIASFVQRVTFSKNFNSCKNFVFITDLVCLLVIACLAFSIYGIFKRPLLPLFLLSLGFVTRMIMSFSPSIWASGARTFFIFDFVLVLVSIMLLERLVGVRKIFLNNKQLMEEPNGRA